VKLRVFDALDKHPLRRMLDAGLAATVNSDDPAYFGGYIEENFREAAAALDLSERQVGELARNALLGSFLDDATKRDLLGRVERHCAA
jgi:adenosine deaminase